MPDHPTIPEGSENDSRLVDETRHDVRGRKADSGDEPRPLGSFGDAHEPHTKKSHWWVWAIVIAVVLLAVFMGYRRRAANAAASVQPAPRPVPIQTVAARKGDIGVYINALGTVTPFYTVTVTARVQGEILNVYYKEGQLVRKGDPLLDIDARPYQAALTQSQGQLAHDQAVLNKDKIDLDRYQLAYNRNAIAKQQLDDQQQTVFQDDGTVKNDQGAVANAQVNLVYTHITSPIDGRVGLRLVDPGNIVQANSTTPLVVVTQLEPITVIFSIAEDYLPQIQKQLKNGQRMTVDAFDRDQQAQIATGSLLTLDNIIDTTTGTVKLKAIFANKDFALFPNQFVNARLTVDTLHDATLLPTATIQRNAQGAFVYLIGSNQTAAIHSITQGATDGDTASVTGINPGDVVALSGFDKLQDGAQVTVRNKSGASGASGANLAGASGPTGPSEASGPSGPTGANRGKKNK